MRQIYRYSRKLGVIRGVNGRRKEIAGYDVYF